MKIMSEIAITTKTYVSPLLEIIDVAVESGFATSSGENEKWNEIPGGGDF